MHIGMIAFIVLLVVCWLGVLIFHLLMEALTALLVYGFFGLLFGGAAILIFLLVRKSLQAFNP